MYTIKIKKKLSRILSDVTSPQPPKQVIKSGFGPDTQGNQNLEFTGFNTPNLILACNNDTRISSSFHERKVCFFLPPDRAH